MKTDYALTCDVFDSAYRQHPDLMERWVVALDGISDQGERQRIMWDGLAQTIRQRYPAPALDAETDADAKPRRRKNEKEPNGAADNPGAEEVPESPRSDA
jgi:hypothetical protein